ncbi:carboxypeptidase-like regulatory domain-containing protein [Polaribacter porphyrae]|uniref:Carboxypeptidase-like regulatory domain-containing protein n=1 Tax=Polaribacter porphyrae TaxID=1137780 RepID=A0A2S7WNU3_9FLAO|nr:carboxypeptidase-like regulatory domain-containing protein [Polaribacter porphyrae]PQJ79270.1 hypothetical protein BTO18_08835 [Polaribacter porphyrae]
MKKIITQLLIFASIALQSQINGKVVDGETKKPIPYCNIWIENKDIGTSSDENGIFKLETKEKNSILIFSAIGYKTTRKNWDANSSIIEMSPEEIILDEIVLDKTKKKNTILGKFKKSKINKFFGCGERPKIRARYFAFDKKINETPFLSEIQFYTMSDIKNAKFNVRLYEVDENGKPGNYLYDKNLIGYARKGNKLTTIDLSHLDILFPKKGFFISVEWFIIQENSYEYTYREEGSRKKMKAVAYDPSFGTIPSDADGNCWIFEKGKWNKILKNGDDDYSKKHRNKYTLLAIQLLLTN